MLLLKQRGIRKKRYESAFSPWGDHRKTNEERFGKTDSGEERQKIVKKLSAEFQEEAMENHGVEFGDRIRGRGKISHAGDSELLLLYLDSMDEDNEEYLEFPTVMSDRDIEKEKGYWL